MPRTLALIGLLFFASGVLADDAATGLARNAWYWQARARSDKAEDAWKEVLQAAPDNPDALAAIGGFAARAAYEEVLAHPQEVAVQRAVFPLVVAGGLPGP